ncbi:MAG: winged helix-turn-helix domain-containing protein [Woeseiaceae bacterium]|nr:winged helix-turn-helix domain-containing protein [Woeseiaceae bacterium]
MVEWNLKSGFKLGEFEVDPMGGIIRSGDQDHRLEPKAMDVLMCLAARAKEVVARDTIAAEVWPGRFISDDPISGRIAELRHALGDSARESTFIETVPKRGYRLVATPKPLNESSRSGVSRWNRRLILVSGVIAFVAITVGLFTATREESNPQPDAPATVAVIPFQSLSSAANDMNFALGLSDVVYHRLLQSSDILVTAKNSSFAYQGQPVDPVSVGRTLGANSIVSGNVQAAEDGYRISIEFTSAKTGETVWSEIVDISNNERFAAQDRIATLLIGEIRDHLSLNTEEHIESAANADLEAYELYLLGRSQSADPRASDAVALFRAAISKYPDFALAYAGLADALWQAARNRDPDYPPEETLTEARAAAEKAIALGPQYADGYASQILFARQNNDVDSAEKWFEKATSVNSGFVPAYIRFADVLQRAGVATLDPSRLDRAAALLNTALLLDPLNARLKQRRALLNHLRGNADALEQARAAYASARSSSEAIIALQTMAEIAGDLGSLDQAIAYLTIASQIGGEPTGSMSLEISAHYLQLGELDLATDWLNRVPRPLDFYGAIQLATLFIETGQNSKLNNLIEEIVSGTSEEVALPSEFGAVLGLYVSESPLNCDNVFRYGEFVDLPMLRQQGMVMPDMLLSLCFEKSGNSELADEHRSLAIGTGEQIDAMSINDAFTFYEIATVKAFARDRDAAIQHLEHAYDRGACFARVIERSVFLNSLDDDHRYVKLMSDFRSTNDRMKRNLYMARQSDDWYGLADLRLPRFERELLEN